MELETAHRPYPLPDGPWVMTQRWNHLLFAHWPVPKTSLDGWIPSPLALDTFDGVAWIGVLPFGMSDIRLRMLPPVPFTDRFPEINVRTYVKHRDRAGIYFFSLDAANALAVAMARTFYSLPYYRARIDCKIEEGMVHYHSIRTHRGIPPASFHARYRPVSDSFTAASGSLDAWLTERYCLFTSKNGTLYRGDIHHLPWRLQSAEAEIEQNGMLAWYPFRIADHPTLLHYSESLEAHIWPLVRETT